MPSKLWKREREVLRPPTKMTVSEWADANIVLLPESSREPGPFRTSRTPYLRDIMDLYAHPDIREITMKCGTQLGKTVTLYNIIGYIIEHDPFSTLLIYPTDEAAREISRTRLHPMIEASDALRRRKPVSKSAFTLSEMSFSGMVLYLVGSNSPTPLSQKPVRNVLMDECDKYPAHIPGHGNPMELSAERFKSFFDIRKVLFVSSPTTDNGNICRQERRCQVILEYFVPCPTCRRLQVLRWEQIKFDNDKALGRVDRTHKAKATAVYQCMYCGRRIGDEHKEWMLKAENGAGWRDHTLKDPPHVPDPMADLFATFAKRGVKLESVAFRLSSIYSPWLRWGDIVGKFMEANLDEARRYDKLRAFRTDWLGIEWRDVVEEKTESEVLKLRCEYPPLVVPKGAKALTLGVDCQKSGFYFVVRAWADDYTSWLIRYGYVLTWEDIGTLIFDDTYEAESGGRKRIFRVGIDTGGGETDGDRSMTQQAYDFISKCRSTGIFGTKGASREMDAKMKLSLIDKVPGKQNLILPGGGVRLWLIDTVYFKDLFFYRMGIKAGDPGCMYLHSETGEDYARQITAEEKRRDEKGRFVWEQVRADNHYLDAEILNSAMVDPACYGGIAMAAGQDDKPRAERTTEKAGRIIQPERNRRDAGWLNTAGKWL